MKVACDAGESGQEQVPEAVALEPAAVLEPVLEQAREQRLIFGERDHAVADVSGREHIELAAEAARAAAVVGDGDDGSHVDGWDRGLSVDRGRGTRVGLETLEERREPGAAPDGDDSQWGHVRQV